MAKFFVYILKCVDNTFYTGYCVDVERRVQAHNHGKNGAKYTRARRPVAVVYVEEYDQKGLALQREIAIKKLTRTQKLKLINR